MSKLNDLIKEYCASAGSAPEVEYKTLGEVCKIEKGIQFNKENMNDVGTYPVINGGINPSGYIEQFNQVENSITISQGGASAGYVNWIKTKFWAGAHCYILKPFSEFVLNRYVYHFLKQNEFKLQECQYGAGIPALSKSTIESLKIPVPPLPVQEEIVRILDKFTSLEAELEARRVQYEYYRDELLTAKTHKTEEVFLEDIAEYSKERIPASEVNADSYVGVDNLLQNRQGKEVSVHIPKDGNLTKYYPNDILIGNIRPYLKKIWFADNMGGTNGDVLVIHPTSEKIIPRYLYFNLSSDRFFDYDNSKAKGAKMPRGDKDVIMKYKLTLPSLEVQQRIVNVLDNFDAMCSDLKIGLPAEIDARKKQYEYYRDLLLTFAERGNTILTEQNRTEQNRTEQNRTEQMR